MPGRGRLTGHRRGGGSISLNCSLASSPSLETPPAMSLATTPAEIPAENTAAATTTAPSTPEILNTIVNITAGQRNNNPFNNFTADKQTASTLAPPPLSLSPPGGAAASTILTQYPTPPMLLPVAAAATLDDVSPVDAYQPLNPPTELHQYTALTQYPAPLLPSPVLPAHLNPLLATAASPVYSETSSDMSSYLGSPASPPDYKPPLLNNDKFDASPLVEYKNDKFAASPLVEYKNDKFDSSPLEYKVPVDEFNKPMVYSTPNSTDGYHHVHQQLLPETTLAQGVGEGAPPVQGGTVQQYHSLFIKEGLKMKVKEKLAKEEVDLRYRTDLNNDQAPSPLDSEEDIKPIKEESLTPEDEERRRRRRERNKVAATKCRNKKKEKTTLLVSESEVLESQNLNLKQEISRLEAEKRHLVDILAVHEPTCTARMAKRPRLQPPGGDNDNFRVPAVPPPRPPRFHRQDSFLEILTNLEDIAEYTEEALGEQQQQRRTEETVEADVKDDDIDKARRSVVGSKQPTTTTSHHNVGGREIRPLPAAAAFNGSSSFPSCSFSRAAKPNYFLVNSPKSLSYSGFDNRCVAL